MNCLECQAFTKNYKFCSKKCSITYNNKTNPRQQRTKKCKICNNLIKSTDKRCKECIIKDRRVCKIHNIVISNKRCSLCNNTNIYNYRLKRKKIMVDLLGGKCNNCGITNIHVLTFHHINEEEKSFSIRDALSKSWKDLLSECSKCALLCANCHLLHHAKEIHLSLSKTNITITEEEIRQKYY